MGRGKIREFNKLPFYDIVLEILGGGRIRIIEYVSASKCTAHIERMQSFTGKHEVRIEFLRQPVAIPTVLHQCAQSPISHLFFSRL